DAALADDVTALVGNVHQVRLEAADGIQNDPNRSAEDLAYWMEIEITPHRVIQRSARTLMRDDGRWGHVQLPIDHLVAVAVVRGVPDIRGEKADARARNHSRPPRSSYDTARRYELDVGRSTRAEPRRTSNVERRAYGAGGPPSTPPRAMPRTRRCASGR